LAADRADVDDARRFTWFSRSAQQWKGGAHDVQRSYDVDLVVVAKLRGIDVEQRRGLADASIVDQRRERGRARLDYAHRPIDGGPVGDAENERHEACTPLGLQALSVRL